MCKQLVHLACLRGYQIHLPIVCVECAKADVRLEVEQPPVDETVLEDRPKEVAPGPPAAQAPGTMAEYKEMVAHTEPNEEGECCLEFWQKADGEIAGFLTELVQRYNPMQPVGGGPTANTGKMRWVDAVDLPRFEQGVVVAAQVARPPLGWTGNHALARCCLRTPRPLLKGGEIGAERMCSFGQIRWARRGQLGWLRGIGLLGPC